VRSVGLQARQALVAMRRRRSSHMGERIKRDGHRSELSPAIEKPASCAIHSPIKQAPQR